jgi:hypothetical protein
MRYQKSPRLLLALLLLAPPALAQSAAGPAAPDAERLRAHVTYLASEKLEGRRTGTRGAEEAARYIADEFKRLGLRPGGGEGRVVFRSGPNAAAGDFRSYFRPFPYVAGVELGGGNALAVTGRAEGHDEETLLLRVGGDWMPLGFGSNAKAEGALALVGYGITAPEQNFDEYKGADVRGKVALAFAGTPDGDNPHGRFARAGEPRFKAAAARAAGAAALLIVAGEEDFSKERLAALAYDNAGGDAGLPVAVISRQAAARLVGVEGPAGLASLEKEAREPGLSGRSGQEAGGGRVAVTRGGSAKGAAVSLTTDVVRKSAPASNVVGVLEGSDPKLKGEVILLGAHYDHLGRGGAGSLAAREGEIHHGADDNASGTAGLLELARLFASGREKMRRTVVFVAFGGEEEGLIGSSHYVRDPALPVEQTVAMLNMDMIGRLRGGALNVGGVGTAAELRAIVEEANRGYKVTLYPTAAGGVKAEEKSKDLNLEVRQEGRPDREAKVRVPDPDPIVVTGADGRTALTARPAERFALRLSEDGFGPSDHSSFYARRVPVLFFFTGSHEDYHKPTDTADRVNYEGEAEILRFVQDIVLRLQEMDARPTYALAKSEAGTRTTFRVSLGTVPSYGESADGLKLDAVREGSPAAAAGLRAGDKIVKLAGRDIRNVYDYTQALSEMQAGREYEVEVLRDGQRLPMKVTPAARR